MSARILQVDLSQPLPAIELEPRYHALWLLVKFGPQPLGWVRSRTRRFGNRLTPDLLRGLIADSLWVQANDAARRRVFEWPAPLANPPSVSVVICTREHPDVLERQLRSIAGLVYPNFEVIVVDNAPRTGRTKAVCDRFPFVRHVLDPRPGLDYARNTGWQVARNEIVAYTDDDACVDPHWLTMLAQNYADPKVSCVTGITFPMELETAAQEYFEKYGGMQRGFHRRVYSPGTWSTFYPLGSGRFGAGVNMSLRRSVLAAMGGFDVALDVGSIARGGGDLDIMARVLRDGGKLVYDPRAICWHQHRRTMSQLRRQMFDYGFGFAAYCMKHAYDLELGNLSMSMLKRWSKRWGYKRLIQNVKLAACGRPHFPIHLILLEVIGGVLGLRAYRRSVRKARNDAVKFRKLGMTPVVSPAAPAGNGARAAA